MATAQAFTGAEPGVPSANGAFNGTEPGTNGAGPSLPAPPQWWSEADEAEWQVLLYEFVGAAWVHRNCSACQAPEQGWCEPLAECWAGLLEWREGRMLRAKAAWLRAREVAG